MTQRAVQITVLSFALSILAVSDLSAQSEPACEEGRIETITVVRGPVFDEAANGALSKLYSAGNWLHIETREDVIRRELLFREGDCLDELRLRESARLLRAHSFIESVRIEPVRRGDGNVDIVVATRDDWSLRVEPRFGLGGGFSVSGVGIAERNIVGRGSAFEFLYVDRSGRDDVGLTYYDPQFLATRWDLDLAAVRTEPGWSVRGSIAYPFLGLVGRWAAFQDALYSERWFRYVVEDLAEEGSSELIQPVIHRRFQIGGAGRVAAARVRRSVRQAVFGLALSYERLSYEMSFFREDSGPNGLLEAAVDSLVADDLRPRETLRLNLLLGFEGLTYVQRRGVSTLHSLEDLAIGASADVILGLAGGALSTDDSHLLVGVDLYGGARVRGNWFSLVRMNGEARRAYEEQRWRDVFAGLEWTNFWLINSRGVNEITARFSAGWETTVPFQLTLGGPWGLAGYAPDRFPGGARLILNVENRFDLLTIGDLFDLGSALFFDVGHMWANDAVFGVDSGLRGSLGAGVRLATPTGSRTTYRLQVAAPLESGVAFRDVIFTLRIDRLLKLEERDTDLQLGRSRDGAINTAFRYIR